MWAILLRIITWAMSSAAVTALTGAGLGLVTSTVILELANKYINSAVSSMSAIGDIAGLLGVAGCDVALSIVIGAIVCRVTVSSLTMHLSKK
jgi:hypothetical protein